MALKLYRENSSEASRSVFSGFKLFGETSSSKLYDFIYRLSPRAIGGCRGVRLEDKLKKHGFTVETREYHQQMLFPSEVILAYKHG